MYGYWVKSETLLRTLENNGVSGMLNARVLYSSDWFQAILD